jgi:hypothetical protein
MADYREETETYGRKLYASDEGATDAASDAAKWAEQAATSGPCDVDCPEPNCLENCEYTQSGHSTHRCPVHGDF